MPIYSIMRLNAKKCTQKVFYRKKARTSVTHNEFMVRHRHQRPNWRTELQRKETIIVILRSAHLAKGESFLIARGFEQETLQMQNKHASYVLFTKKKICLAYCKRTAVCFLVEFFLRRSVLLQPEIRVWGPEGHRLEELHTTDLYSSNHAKLYE